MPFASVRALLEKAHLPQYIDCFIERGWDDVPFLMGMDEPELAVLAEDVGMKKGHLARFQTTIQRASGSASSSSHVA